MKVFLSLLLLCCTVCGIAQQAVINILDSGRKVSLRGLSVVNDTVFWASGTGGSVARSVNGGATIEWLTVRGYEARDFRDVEAFDANHAIIMAVAEPSIILKTKDGGKSWYKVFEDTTKGMFLDAMDFDARGNGVVIGDPIQGVAYLATTSDFGEHWTASIVQTPLAEGEAFFASSGTNIRYIPAKKGKNSGYAFASGGKRSAAFPANIPLPLIQGKETTGANSLACFDTKHWIIVGGDFMQDKDTTGNCAFTSDGGKTWQRPVAPPHGYRSCVEYITSKQLIACGTSGVDLSGDGGNNWQLVSPLGFHVCRKAKNGSKVYLAGGRGKIAILQLP